MTTTEPPRARPKAVRDSKPRTSSRTELRSWRLPECLPRMLGRCPNPRVTSNMWGHPSHGMHTGIRALVIATRESIG